MSKIQNAILIILLSAYLLLFCNGCSTIIFGKYQEVSIISEPTGAAIVIDENDKGVSPLIIKLRRKNIHIVEIRLDGYKPYEVVIRRNLDGNWLIGSTVLGLIIGLGVDFYTGAIYKLEPDHIRATLAEHDREPWMSDNTIYAVLVKEPDETWEKIGSLVADE